MSNILFSVNAVFPLILIALAGYFLKRIKLISKELAAGMNRLVFRLFLPCMLFLNIYKIEVGASIDLTYVWYTLGITGVLFLIALPLTKLITKENRQRGVLVQASFRSNYALVGIPLSAALFGETGATVATLLSAFLIPLYNVLAVICLTVFSGETHKKINVKKILLDIVKNPLIQAIALGCVVLGIRSCLVHFHCDFRLDTNIPLIYKSTHLFLLI